MRQAIENRLHELMTEIDNLNGEKQALKARDEEIQVRMHQLVGAIYELQQLISLESQPSEKQVPSGKPEDPFETADWTRQSTRPSEGADLNIHQGLPEETEKNSPQQS